MEKVFWESEPDSSLAGTFLSGMYGESLSFQVAYTINNSEQRNTYDAYINVESALANHIRLYRVGNIMSNYPVTLHSDDDYLSKKPGLFPDILQEVQNNFTKIVSGAWCSLWVEIELTEKISKGEYPVRISLADQNGVEYGSASLIIKVIGITLPSQRLLHTEWFYCDCLANYYDVEVFGERHWEIIGNFIEAAVGCGVNMILTPIFTPPLDTEIGGERTTTQLVDIYVKNGTYRFGFDKLDRWVGLCRQKGIEYFEMAHLFSQWGAQYAPKIVANVDGVIKKIFGWENEASSTDYRSFLDSFLPALIWRLNELGIASHVFFHISDEPNEGNLESYQSAREIVLPYLKDFQIIDALSSYDFYQKGIVTKPIPSNDHIHTFIDAGVKELWTYYCVSQGRWVSNRFVAMPSARNRIIATQLYKYDIQGFLHWGFNSYYSQLAREQINPYQVSDSDYAFPTGDAFLVYPGAKGRPVKSIRYMVFREAMQDLRAFALLESMTDKENVMHIIEKDTTAPIRFDCYPKSARYILEMREAVNRAIDEKQKGYRYG